MRLLAIAELVVLVGVLAVYARHGAKLMRESAAGPIGTGFLLGMMGLALVWLVQLPFSLVGHWWARRYDVVELDYLEWFVEDTAILAGEALFVCVVLLVVMALARVVRSAWWAPATAAFVGISLFFMWSGPYLYPDLQPPSAAIRADTQRLTRDGDLPRVPVRVEEVREFTNAPNAFAMGLGDTRRIVLWDTLVEDFPRPEVRVVLAHELAHHEHGHLPKSLGWLAITVLPTALIVALLTRGRGGLGRPEVVPLALLVATLLSLLTTPLMNSVSRRYEAEADWTALNATKDPRAMERLFRRFTVEGLADPDPPGWWHALFETHPSGAERVAMARAWAERQRSGR